ncbi:MAG: hypothetical protein LLG15_01525 [Betaproteobacteria bacterium]|nr:hypothetical protein [Betaproteobacteria bacterium]
MSTGYQIDSTCYTSLNDAAAAWSGHYPQQQAGVLYSLVSNVPNVGAGSIAYTVKNGGNGTTSSGTVYPSVCNYQSNFNMPVADIVGATGFVLCFAVGAILGALT